MLENDLRAVPGLQSELRGSLDVRQPSKSSLLILATGPAA